MTHQQGNVQSRRYPAQVQVYHNDLDSANQDSRSQVSYGDRSYGSSAARSTQANNNNRNPYTDYGNNNFGSYVCETYDNEGEKENDFLPEGNILIKTINGKPANTFALCLFDSGSTVTLMNQRALPPGITPKVGNN